VTSREYHLHDGKKGSALAIRVTTRARKNEIVEILNDGTVKIRLKSPSTTDEANLVLINYLAEILKIPPSKIEIVAGESGRDKLVTILDLDANKVHERILLNIA